MKKTILSAVAVAFVLTFTSCKKDYTCSCKGTLISQDYPLEDVKKKDAEDACNSLSATWTLAGGSCSLK